MDSIDYKPISIGHNAVTGEVVEWPWSEAAYSTMSIVGGADNSPRLALVDSIVKEAIQQDAKSVFQIRMGKPNSHEIAIPSDAISWSGQFSDPPSDVEDRDIFIGNRIFFCSNYFGLLAQSKGVLRSELLPPTSYRWNLEGPLEGYRRAIENLDSDHPHKLSLQSELKRLDENIWYQSDSDGRCFYIDDTNDVYALAQNFLFAVWSFWAEIGKMDDPQPILLVIDMPKSLVKFSLDPEVTQVVIRALEILRYLSRETTTTMLLSSEMLYPAPELHFRHKIIFQSSEDGDFNLENEEINHYFSRDHIQYWLNHQSTSGILFDDLENVHFSFTPTKLS